MAKVVTVVPSLVLISGLYMFVPGFKKKINNLAFLESVCVCVCVPVCVYLGVYAYI